MRKYSLIIPSLLLAALIFGIVFQGCVKPGDSATNSSSSASEEPEFSLTGEAI